MRDKQYRTAFNEAVDLQFTLMDDIDKLKHRIAVLQGAAQIFDQLDLLDSRQEFDELISTINEFKAERKLLSVNRDRNLRFDIIDCVLSKIGIEEELSVPEWVTQKYKPSKKSKAISRIFGKKK